jgi:hypothetical protein
MPFAARLTVRLRMPNGAIEDFERAFFSPSRWEESARVAVDKARAIAAENNAVLIEAKLVQVAGLPSEVAG